jgi:misacylated tRNA(Ala) deacylase
VGQVIDERRRVEKRVEDVERELAGLIAENLVRDMGAGDRQVFKRHIHRRDDSGTALGLLSAISSAFVAVTAASGAQASYVIVLSSSASSQSATSTSVVLVFGSDDEKVKEVGKGLKERLRVKGGGKGTRWSGKFVGVWKEGREDALVAEILRGA